MIISAKILLLQDDEMLEYFPLVKMTLCHNIYPLFIIINDGLPDQQ